MATQLTEQAGHRPAFSPELQGLMALVGRALGLPGDLRLDPAPAAWSRLLKLAETHRVLPLVHAGLKAAPEICVPADVSACLALQANGLWRRSLILSQELARLSRLLCDHDIAMAAMKGPGLSAQAYGPGVPRAMRDLDILIRPEDFRQVQAILEAGGFVCEVPVSSLTRPLQEIYLRSATHISFQHAALGYCLEVHLRPMQVPSLLSISTETLLSAACLVPLGGGEVPVLAPRHHFLYAAAHGAKHGWWRLLWLADFAAFRRTAQEWFGLQEGRSASEAACKQGLHRVLGAADVLCHLSFGMPLPAPAGNKSVSARSIRALAEHGRRCLERGGPPQSYAEKYAELFHLLRLRPQSAYRRDVAGLYWELTTADLAFLSEIASLPAARFFPSGILASLAPALRPILWAIRRVPPVRPSHWKDVQE